MIDNNTPRPPSIPEHVWPSIREYVLRGRPTGSCLRALFANDLFECVARADDQVRAALPDMAMWVLGCCPTGCAGGYANVDAWIEAAGLEGILAEHARGRK